MNASKKTTTAAVTSNNSKKNGNNLNSKDVIQTTTTPTAATNNDHNNKTPRVEKVLFDNRIKRKNVLALNEKVAAIREYEKRPVYKRIGRMFLCSPDQIKRIVQQKDTILKAWEQRTRKSRDAKTLEMKVVKVSMLGKAVYEWIRRMMYYKDILITDGLIQKMALQFKSAMGLQNFFPHQEWCDKFRSTYKIPTCDSKMLDIGYTQGHSVQIKDVMKDVLYECSPESQEDEDRAGTLNYGGDGENGNCENDFINLDSDEGDIKIKRKSKEVATKDKGATKTTNNEINSNPVQLMPSKQLQGIRQLMALPIPTNGLPGMSQKVLVATPIVAPGQNQNTTPMTMTIIPLASITQPTNAMNTSTTPLSVSTSSQNSMSSSKDQRIAIPCPMVEIKKEIKEEPKDEEDMTEKDIEEMVHIKKEYLTDDEDEFSTAEKSLQQQNTSLNTNTPAHVVSIPLPNKDMMEESTNDSLDDLSLSSLRKRIKIEGSNAEQDISEKNNSPPPLVSLSVTPAHKSIELLPMPPLTKAPTQTNATPLASTSTVNSVPSLTPLPPTNRSCHKRLKSSDDYTSLPPIRSYAEGRKYLKLLEDFALERENFRLIGLITRADEVLRELDRKENNEDEDVDID